MVNIKPFSPICPDGYCAFCFWHSHIYVPLNHIVITIPQDAVEWETSNAEFRKKLAKQLLDDTLKKYDFAKDVLNGDNYSSIYFCKIGDNHRYYCPNCGIKNVSWYPTEEIAFTLFSDTANIKLDEIQYEQIRDVLSGILD